MNISGSGFGDENIMVIRYKAANAIRDMMEQDQIIEAFVHAQLGIEKILWDKIVQEFTGQRGNEVRTKIETSRDGKDKAHTSSYDLIKWSHFLCAINDDDYSNLNDFNSKRNSLAHGHGNWWNIDSYKEALKKGIRFMEQNGF